MDFKRANASGSPVPVQNERIVWRHDCRDSVHCQRMFRILVKSEERLAFSRIGRHENLETGSPAALYPASCSSGITRPGAPANATTRTVVEARRLIWSGSWSAFFGVNFSGIRRDVRL
jgi:hypothetical protein